LAEWRVGAGTTEFLVKLAVGVFALHLGLALLSSTFQLTWYQTLTTTEASVIQGFINWFFDMLNQVWHGIISILFGQA
jgi:hypothetical protein